MCSILWEACETLSKPPGYATVSIVLLLNFKKSSLLFKRCGLLIVVKRICNAQGLEIFESLTLRSAALVDILGDFFFLGVVLGVFSV